MGGKAVDCGWGAMVTPRHGEEDGGEDEERLASWKSLCSWLLTMLFMALCISANILCFSRFGMRPKRTAAGGDTDRQVSRERGELTDR